MGGTCTTCETVEKFTQNLSRKPKGKRPRGRPRRRWYKTILELILGK